MSHIQVMKARLVCVLVFLFVATICSVPARTNVEPLPVPNQTPGQEIARAASVITGVAISPLLGIGAIGAWQYFHAKTESDRTRLPWFANPWFWIPALTLVTLSFIKDTAGASLPVILKKPFDLAELVEHKLSGLIVAGLFVPLVASIFQTNPGSSASLAAMGFAAVDISWAENALSIIGALFIFFIVFLASNAVNVLILLSPFPPLDAALKAFRTAILGSVVVTAWMNPWIGLAWALLVIVASWFIAGWSFRLSCFGMVYAWEWITHRCDRFQPAAQANRMFLGRKSDKVPARTYGSLKREPTGDLNFHYRPWLILPRRMLKLAPGQFDVGRGLIYSEIRRVEASSDKTMFLLPPRYRGHEQELAAIYGFGGPRPVGIHAAWKWFKELLRGNPVTVSPA